MTNTTVQLGSFDRLEASRSLYPKDHQGERFGVLNLTVARREGAREIPTSAVKVFARKSEELDGLIEEAVALRAELAAAERAEQAEAVLNSPIRESAPEAPGWAASAPLAEVA